MAQISVEKLMERRTALVEQFKNAQAVMEQTRGAITMVDEMIQQLTQGADGAAEKPDDMEAPGNTERQLSS